MSWSLLQSWEVVVAQLVERSLSTPVVHGSNPSHKLYSKEEYWEKEAWNGPFVFKKTFAKLSTCLTFARASSAVLAVDIFADAVASSILRSGVVAFPASELETVCTARRPRSPRWPFTIDGWADLVARLLLNVRTFAARSAVDWGRLVAGSSPGPGERQRRKVGTMKRLTGLTPAPRNHYISSTSNQTRHNLYYNEEKLLNCWKLG